MPDDDSLPRSDAASGPTRQNAYRLLSAAALSLIAIATVVYRVAEGWTWVDSVYFSVITVTTVGFGDLTPTSDFTKLFTVAYVLTGVSLVAAVIDERLRRHHEALYRLARRAGPGPESGDQRGQGDPS